MPEDFYDLLELSPDASQDDVKAAFRDRVRVYHPDVNDDERARAQFTALKKAYDILSDPVERQAYDRMGHEDYVAKRTSGIPSPDVWGSSDDESKSSDEDSDGADSTATTGRSSTASGRTSAAGGAERTAGRTGSTAGRSTNTTGSSSRETEETGRSGASSAGSATTGSTGRRSGASGTGRAGSARETADAGRASESRSRTGGSTSTATGSAGATAGSGAYGAPSSNPVVRWWNRRNFSLPLLWLSILAYLAGLAHFASANEGGLRSFAADVSAAGTPASAVESILGGGRHGIETPLSFVAGVELVAPPIEPLAWYAALAGLVALALAAIVAVRVRVYRLTWQRLTINETILVALAVGVATTLLGGPLLAGAALMPLLFGVIIYRTRQLPGWAPSYAYVLAVCAPLLGFTAYASGSDSLAIDLTAFVVVPILGALGLPLRLTIRRRLGR